MRSVHIGLLLIFIGIILLLQSFNFVSDIWEYIWPTFILIPALGFHISYFSNRSSKSAGLLVPGGILFIISGLFFYHTITGWESLAYTWPFYLVAVAFGLFELYLFGEREKGLLIPIFILTGIALIFLLSNYSMVPIRYIWPILLIITGFSLIFQRK